MAIEVTKTANGVEIILDKEDVLSLCHPGQEDKSCLWLAVGNKGFQCTLSSRPFDLLDRYRKGLTISKRDGCDKVREMLSKEAPESICSCAA